MAAMAQLEHPAGRLNVLHPNADTDTECLLEAPFGSELKNLWHVMFVRRDAQS